MTQSFELSIQFRIHQFQHKSSKMAFYFGVWNSNLGHSFRDVQGNSHYDGVPEMPWKPWDIDGRLQPHRQGCKLNSYCGCGDLPEGMSKIHHKDGWTALSFWDRSLDKRPASNSNFFFRGDHSFDEMIELAKKSFPKVVSRFKFKIEQVDQS